MKINLTKIISIIFLAMSLFFFYWIFYLINNYNIQETGISKAILISLTLAILYLISSIGFWKRKKYGRTIGIIITIFFTIASIISFLKMIHPGVFFLFIVNLIILFYLILSKKIKIITRSIQPNNQIIKHPQLPGIQTEFDHQRTLV